ncbi:MAG: hypothetical protein R2753_17560 [Chitinophagales bacterium]
MIQTTRLLLTIILLLLSTSIVCAQENTAPEPHFIGYYFTNRNNEKIEDLYMEDKFTFLVIETSNAIGEKVVLTLDDNDGEWIYKNKYISTNSSIRFKIKDDFQKVKFKIYNPKRNKHNRLKEKAM